jgi:hypothetical protein
VNQVTPLDQLQQCKDDELRHYIAHSIGKSITAISTKMLNGVRLRLTSQKDIGNQQPTVQELMSEAIAQYRTAIACQAALPGGLKNGANVLT